MISKKEKILIPDHIYVPKHEIMNKDDAMKVLEKYHTKPTEMPLIYVSDPAIRGLGVKPGESVYYRYVVEE